MPEAVLLAKLDEKGAAHVPPPSERLSSRGSSAKARVTGVTIAVVSHSSQQSNIQATKDSSNRQI